MAESPAAEAPPVSDAPDPGSLLREGLALQQAGQRHHAARRYQQVLHYHPDHPDAWHLLGLLDLAHGKANDALEKIERAIAQYPEHPQFFASRIRAELSLNLAAQALLHAREYEARWPSDSQASVLLGLAMRHGEPKAAEEHFRKALAQGQKDPEIFFELAQLSLDRDEPEPAIAELEQGLAYHPKESLLLNQLGIARSRLNQDDLAEASWLKALQCNPQSWEARANYGQFLAKAGRGRESLSVLLPRMPECTGYAQYWLSLALAYTDAGDTLGALEAFREVQAREPDNAMVNLQLGHACLEAGRLEEAKQFIARSIDLGQAPARGELLLFEIAKKQCDWTAYRRLFSKLPQWLEEIDTLRPPAHWFVSAPVSAAVQKRTAEAYSTVVAAPPNWSRQRPSTRRSGRIRLGYVTAAIRNHPTPSLITEVWERHDRSRFEVFVYSCSPDDGSIDRKRISRAIEHFVDCGRDPDDQICRRIAQDEIDLLVDLDGYIQHARPRVFAARVAPVQISYLGFPGTLGSTRYDYIVTDRVVTPPSAQEHFAERFLYVPHCYLPSDTLRRPMGAAPVRAKHGLSGNAFVYCCFNGLYKLTPDVFGLWMSILRETEPSVLWLLSGEPLAMENLRREASSQGIDPRRLIFAPPLPAGEHLARYPLADLFLDTLPCNAHTTCNDALLMGLPVLTRIGETFSGRVAASQLQAVGMPGLVTNSVDEYRNLAIDLARSPEALAAHRAHLAQNGLRSPLFDMVAYTRALEEGYGGICSESPA